MNSSDLLIALLRAELCNDYNSLPDIPTESRKNVAESVFELANAHDLAHFIYEPMKKIRLIEDGSEIEAKLKKQQMLAVFRYKRIDHELNALSTFFEDNQIPFVLLKGSIIRKYYEKPWMRTSCDIDILIKESDFEKAVELIISKLSYKADGEKNYHDISLYSPSGVHLELHFNINEGMENLDKVLRRVWDFATPCEPGKFQHVLTPEFFVFHEIAHMAYHFVNGGCGIRPFMDMHLIKNKVKYNEAELVSLCDEAKLSNFYPSILRLTSCWFGSGEKDNLCESMQNYLILGGVYGTFENKIALAHKKRGGQFKYILSRIFMPKEQLKRKYPILNRQAWLLPFCHIHRWFGVLFGGKLKKSMSEAKMSANISEERADETATLMKNIGLY